MQKKNKLWAIPIEEVIVTNTEILVPVKYIPVKTGYLGKIAGDIKVYVTKKPNDQTRK
jgi:hypothetical protein